MDDGAAGEEAGASSSSAGADSSDDSLPQPAPIPLVDSIDEALAPDIIAGTPGTSSVFQSALVGPPVTQHILQNTTHNFPHKSLTFSNQDAFVFLKLCFFPPPLLLFVAACIFLSSTVSFCSICMASCAQILFILIKIFFPFSPHSYRVVLRVFLTTFILNLL